MDAPFPRGRARASNIGRVTGASWQVCRSGVRGNGSIGGAGSSIPRQSRWLPACLSMGSGDAFIGGRSGVHVQVPMDGPLNIPAAAELDGMRQCRIHQRLALRLNGSPANTASVASTRTNSLSSVHQKAKAGGAAHRFDDEIVPIRVDDMEIRSDGCPRDTSLQKLSNLSPAFLEKGSVTAGNSSPMSDGASALLVCERRIPEAT